MQAVANPNLPPTAKYSILSQAYAQQMNEKDLRDAWAATNPDESKRPNANEFAQTWKNQNPYNYQKRQWEFTQNHPYFAGMDPDSIDKTLMYRRSDDKYSKLDPTFRNMPPGTKINGKDGNTYVWDGQNVVRP